MTTPVADHHQAGSGKSFPWPGVLGLTLLFAGAYFVLRSLPNERCGFLHYEEVVNTEGEIEFCATNHAEFLDLEQLKYPVEMGIKLEGEAVPGQPVRVTLELLNPGGMPIAAHELAVTHTEKMHVMLIDPSQEDYHHVHPQAKGMDGHYTFEFTPERSGAYRVFAEMVPLQARRQVIATGVIPVRGEAASAAYALRTESVVDGIRFSLSLPQERLRSGRDYRCDLYVVAVDGRAVQLEEIMGARGHMVAFDAEGRGFAHMHPLDGIAAVSSGLTEGRENSDVLAFLINLPNSGWYRLFAQVKIDGREVFGRFDLKVE